MSDIPTARERLREIAADLIRGNVTPRQAAAMIRVTLPMMMRQSPVRRSPRRCRPVTPDIKDAIRRHARDCPDAQLKDIAQAYDVNPGRVSEILNGRR